MIPMAAQSVISTEIAQPHTAIVMLDFGMILPWETARLVTKIVMIVMVLIVAASVTKIEIAQLPSATVISDFGITKPWEIANLATKIATTVRMISAAASVTKIEISRQLFASVISAIGITKPWETVKNVRCNVMIAMFPRNASPVREPIEMPALISVYAMTVSMIFRSPYSTVYPATTSAQPVTNLESAKLVRGLEESRLPTVSARTDTTTIE